MRSLAILSSFAALLGMAASSYAFTVDATCDSRRDDVLNALNESLAMAQYAADYLSLETSSNTRVDDLLWALLGGVDDEALSKVQTASDYLKAVADFARPPKEMTILCDDSFIEKQGDGTWLDTRTKDAVVAFSPCAQNQLLGYGLSSSAIVICPKQEAAMAKKKMAATIGESRAMTAENQYIDDYLTLSGHLLHQLLRFSQSVPQVDDQNVKAGPAYGFKRCWQLREEDRIGKTDRAVLNADTLTLLAVGLYFPNLDFMLGSSFEVPPQLF
ncbi:MAG: hypothetical protein M1832_000473 [Thelocarpon impressellum]|nr:MAG: hypothetical protein M1832_000473 [Thelocarpon impressellum]